MPTRIFKPNPTPGLFTVVWLTVLAVYLLTTGGYALADVCFAPSPSYAGGHTPFEAITVRDLTRAEQKMLTTLFKSLKGRWKGDAEDVQCSGREDSPFMERLTLSIDAEVKTNHRGDLKLRAKLRSNTEKTNFVENFDFAISDDQLVSIYAIQLIQQ